MEELIDSLYNICKTNSKEALYNNKELFQQFFYHFNGIYKFDERIYLIFKTILNNHVLYHSFY